MNKVWLVLHKEFKEIFQQRSLIIGMCVFPLIIVLISGYTLYAAHAAGDQQGQISIGNLFRLYVLVDPLFIPSMIAAYGIVGEKNNRTLEPLLATPLETWKLLLAKSLSASIPAMVATWLTGGIFVAELAVFASAAVFAQVITLGWLILLVVTTPVLTLIPVALAVITSSRLNDPRAASQISSVILIILLFVFGITGYSLIIGPTQALFITAVLALLGVILLRAAIAVFQRETILTRWK
jgi:ABC-2 type transport system permease protein